MARFRYRLATLLRLREAARDEKRAQLADAYRAAQILAERRAELEAEMAAERARAAAAARPGTIDVDQLLQVHRYEIILRAERQALAQQEQQVAAEIERRRQVLVEADRAVHVLEKLRERKLAEYVAGEEHLDRKRLDEAAQIVTLRRQESPP